MSSPPKQMLVVMMSSVGTCSTKVPSGEMTVIPPLKIVATHTLPSPSTASESKQLHAWQPAQHVALVERHEPREHTGVFDRAPDDAAGVRLGVVQHVTVG